LNRPSSSLFRDFCDDLVRRHSLDSVLIRSTVVSIRVLNPTLIQLTLASGDTLTARNVVFAMGATVPVIPDWALRWNQALSVPLPSPQAPASTANTRPLPIATSWDVARGHSNIAPNTLRESILIVGGGLTAAQLAQKARQEYGFKKVKHPRNFIFSFFFLDPLLCSDLLHSFDEIDFSCFEISASNALL
jgi:hypothetical protein